MSPIRRSLWYAVLALGFAASSAGAQHAHENGTRVAILMFDGVQIIDFAGPYEVFGHAGFEIYTVSPDGEPVTTAMNLHVNVDHDFASAPEADIVLVPGGSVRDAAQDPLVLDFLRSRAPSADHMLSVCTGSFILAATGLLDGKQATTFHHSFDSMAATFPDVQIVRDRRWVDTGKLVTSAGLASGIDAALHVVSEVQGVEMARTVAMMLEYQWSPEQGFVRGLMADQHLRLPAITYPAGTQILPRISYGDEDSWKMVLQVRSDWTPAELIASMREHAADDESLRVLETDGTDQVAWQYVDDARRWEVRLATAESVDDGAYNVIAELAVLD